MLIVSPLNTISIEDCCSTSNTRKTNSVINTKLFTMTYIGRHVRRLWLIAVNFLRELNLFPSIPPSTNPSDLRNERISTRLFVISLIVSITILVGYTALINITKTNTINSPTLTDYRRLYSIYPQTLACPCTKVAINYEKFLRINYTLHQVCSSAFVSDEWITFLAQNRVKNVLATSDFLVQSTFIFQALKAFCDASDRMISDSLSRFYINDYTSLTVQSEELFQSQSQILMGQFISTTLNTFLSLLQILRAIAQANGLMPALQTNYLFFIFPDDNNIYQGTYDSDCTCDVSSKCIRPMYIYDPISRILKYLIPGLHDGCYIVEALLQSTLECFYDAACIDILQRYITSSSSAEMLDVSSLDSSLSSRFHVKSLIEDLVDQLMVEQWNRSSVYENYYKECQPTKCTYTYETKNDTIYVITALLGLIGGLVRLLKLLIPTLGKLIARLIRIIRKHMKLSKLELEPVTEKSKSSLIAKLKYYFQTINLFPSTNSSDLRNERISTRLFIISLIVSITILVGYTALINITKTNTINSPTLTDYRRLYSIYPQTLACPCTKVGINYEKFLRINYTFHQVCSSAFVSDEWITYLGVASAGSLKNFLDNFNLVSTYIFETLNTFCDASDRTISDSLSRFYSNQYASLSVPSEQLFQSQSQIIMEQFISSTLNDFLFSLQVILDTTEANSLYTITGSQYTLSIESRTQTIVSSPENYADCSCVTGKCVSEVAFYNYSTNSRLFNVPGIYTGCYIVEATLQSTLECFYNQTCINTVQSYMAGSSGPFIISSLNLSLTSRFNQTSSVQELVNQLMVEQWNLSSVYEKYYSECQPMKCSYTYQTKNAAIYIVTTLFSLIGGLMTVLKFLIPRLVKLIPRFLNKIKRLLRLSKSETEDNLNQPTVGLWQKLKTFFHNFNLFASRTSTTNEFDLRNQRISTRIFILSLILAMIILITYTSSVNVTKTITTKTPTVAQYSDLYSKHSQILTCPCTKIAIKYQRFLQAQYTLHQVCSSTFVNHTYIQSILTTYTQQSKTFQSFVKIYPYILHALASFCQLMDKLLSDSLTRFYSNQYLSATVTSKELFQLQAQSAFQQFVYSSINELLFSMQFIRNTTQANTFFSGLFTNYYFVMQSNSDNYDQSYGYDDGISWSDVQYFLPVGIQLSTCNCVISPLCVEQAVILNGNHPNTTTFTVPGLYTGCYVIEALLQSTLECFYNQTCVDILEQYRGSLFSLNLTSLDSSLSTRYTPYFTVQELLNDLMVESWNLSITYENYYEDCKPAECSYSYTTRIDAIYIATTTFGLFGGLMVVMKCFIPPFVRLIARCIWRRKVVPDISFIET